MSTTTGPGHSPVQPIYMTIQDVAELLRTTPATVRWWRHTGYGPRGVRVGRRVLYPANAVVAWVEPRGRRSGIMSASVDGTRCADTASADQPALPLEPPAGRGDLLSSRRTTPPPHREARPADMPVSLHVVLSGTGRRRGVLLVDCPLCGEVHQHNADPGFTTGIRRAACGLGRYDITTRDAS
jgi:hypothetical protein